MEIHSVQTKWGEEQIKKLAQQQVKRVVVAPFTDPIREFARASQTEGMVRNWLTYPVEERKKRIKEVFAFRQQRPGEVENGILPESDEAYKAWKLERWRGLCVVIQEESRALPGNRCPEVAVYALKLLFPDLKTEKAAEPQK